MQISEAAKAASELCCAHACEMGHLCESADFDEIVQKSIDEATAEKDAEIERLRAGIAGLEAVLGAGGNIEWPNSRHVLSHRLSNIGIVNCFNELLATGATLADAIYALAGGEE